jgi:hypothetical protein
MRPDGTQDIRDVGVRSAPQFREPIIRLRFGGFLMREALSNLISACLALDLAVFGECRKAFDIPVMPTWPAVLGLTGAAQIGVRELRARIPGSARSGCLRELRRGS